MGEKKTTVFEINVENLEFSPSASGLDRMLGATGDESDEESTGPSLGLFGSEDDGVEEDVEIDDEAATGVDVEDAEDAEEADVEDGGVGIGLVIGLLFLLVVAVVAKKFALDSETEEYEEVELSDYES